MKRMLFALARLAFGSARRRPIVAADIQRILVIKLCCIGDVLFTTPLLRALHEYFPRARVTFMVVPWCRELVAAHPAVAEVLLFDAYTRVPPWTRARQVATVVDEIRAGRFDLSFSLHRTALAALLPALGGVRLRFGFDWEGRGFALTHPVPYRSRAHEVDRYLDCLRPLGISSEDHELELYLTPDAEAFADRFLHERGVRPGPGPLIAVLPGGGVNPGTVMLTKRWPAAGFREVCRWLQQHYGARFLFVGGKDDAAVTDDVLHGLTLDPPALRAEGKTGLLQTAALLSRCDLFVGNDSGPLHMAAAVGTPTVAVFGPTDPDLLAPRGPRHRVVRATTPCVPCYTPETVHEADVTVCRLGTQVCMAEIPPEPVWQAAADLLQEKGFERR